MSTADEHYLAHRRRAALAALSGHLTADYLRDALWLLQKEYTKPGVHSLIRFVDVVATKFGIAPSERKVLYKELFRWMNAVDERDLPADPWPLMNGAEQPVPPPASSRAQRSPVSEPVIPNRAEDVVFFGLIKDFVSVLAVRGLDEQELFHRHLDASIRQLSGIGAGSAELCRWLAELNSPPATLSLNREQMSAVIHAVYLAFGLAIGRQDADDALENAVALVRRLPEAEVFPPEGLLWADFLMVATASSH